MLTPPNSSYGGAGANNPPPFPRVADGPGDAAHAEAALGPQCEHWRRALREGA